MAVLALLLFRTLSMLRHAPTSVTPTHCNWNGTGHLKRPVCTLRVGHSENEFIFYLDICLGIDTNVSSELAGQTNRAKQINLFGNKIVCIRNVQERLCFTDKSLHYSLTFYRQTIETIRD